jgi:LL-diaminopimelate aminotransferase
VLAGCRVRKMPVSRQTGWKPVLEGTGHGAQSTVGEEAGAGARLLWVNYPSNPTAASADVAFYERVVEYCVPRGIIAASDLAYSEIYLEGEGRRPASLYQARNASIDETRAIEFHSLSKTFNMTGWRIGFAVGHAEVVGALNSIKSNVDSGTFNAIQAAGAAALNNWRNPAVERMRRLYRERRDAVVPALEAIGCEVDPIPDAGFFVWARTPRARAGGAARMDSMAFASRLLEESDTVVVPGAGFSAAGREYFRVALTVEAARIREAGERAKRIAW